jgi:cellulose biosynthesis protein BcsQ
MTAREIRDLASGYDLTLIDTPPGAASQALAALEAADLVIAVTALGTGDMAGLVDLLRVVDPDLIVPTRRDGRRVLHAQAIDALERQWPGLITTPIPASAAVERAQAAHTGLPYSSTAAHAYRDVYRRLLELER